MHETKGSYCLRGVGVVISKISYTVENVIVVSFMCLRKTYKHLQTIILELLRSCYAKREFKCYYVNHVDEKNHWRGSAT